MTVRTTVKEQAEILKNGAKYQAVKAHVKKNQKFYMGFGAGVLVVLVTRRPAVHIVNTVTPVFNNVNQQVNLGGHATKMVKCLETGEIWETVTSSAKASEAPLSLMSRHLNGKLPNVYGKHYQIIGIGTTG